MQGSVCSRSPVICAWEGDSYCESTICEQPMIPMQRFWQVMYSINIHAHVRKKSWRVFFNVAVVKRTTKRSLVPRIPIFSTYIWKEGKPGIQCCEYDDSCHWQIITISRYFTSWHISCTTTEMQVSAGFYLTCPCLHTCSQSCYIGYKALSLFCV